MDILAGKLGIDRLELRTKNAAQEGDLRPNNQPWPRIGLHNCLERLREHPLWQRARRSTGRSDGTLEGYGLAIGGWLGGLQPTDRPDARRRVGVV